VIITLNDSL